MAMAAGMGNLKRNADDEPAPSAAKGDGGQLPAPSAAKGDEPAPSAAPPPPAQAAGGPPPAKAAGDPPAAENQPPGRCF